MALCKKALFLVMLLSCFVASSAGIELDVVVTGTTMSPGYKRKEGEESLPCPDTHPWVFNSGSNCCQHFNRLLNATQALNFNDPLSQCNSSQTLPCPEIDKICIQNYNITGQIQQCPVAYPISINNGMHCCSSINRNSNNQGCDGGKLLRTDPAECCLNGDYQICSNAELLCNTTVTEVLIARQDIRGPMQVFNISNYLSLNKGNTSALFYSRLEDLESFRLYTGKFHLKLCYPLLTDALAPCFEFKQSSHPLTINNITQNVQGLEIIQRMYSNEYYTDIFTGLRSDSTAYPYNFSYLDGDKGNNWYNGILTIILHGPDPTMNNQMLIPGPLLVVNNGTALQERNTYLAELFTVMYN